MADFPFRPHKVEYCFHGDNTQFSHDCFQAQYIAMEQYLRQVGKPDGLSIHRAEASSAR